ncbi:MAG: hypothetical protein R6W70_07625 [bacterium]
MSRCFRCGLESNNSYVCRGCGHDLEQNSSEKSSFTDFNETGFFDEVISVLDNIYVREENEEIVNIPGTKIAMELVAEENAVIIDNRQWKEIDSVDMLKGFFSDMSITVFLAALMSLFTWFLITTDTLFVFQTYIISYMSTAFLVWFIFPFFFESTPSTFMKDFIFAKGIQRVKGDWGTFLLLWVFSCVYSVVFPLFFELIAYFF